MASQLQQVWDPQLWMEAFQNVSTELSALWRSRIIVPDAEIQSVVDDKSLTLDMPFFNDLDDTEANKSNQSQQGGLPAAPSDSVPLDITSSQDRSRKHQRNQSWRRADVLTGWTGTQSDPMDFIVRRIAEYWVRQDQRLLISTVKGIMADNALNNGGDMNHTAAGVITAEDILDAQQTMGDHSQNLVAIAMHSRSLTVLKKANLIDFVPDSEGLVRFPTFMGLDVIEDDQMPFTGPNYQTWLFAEGAIGFAEGNEEVPFEEDRKPEGGLGGGEHRVYSRRKFVLHPRGIAWQEIAGGLYPGDTATARHPSNADIEDAARWTRVYDRKLVRIAQLTHTVA